MRVPVHYWPNWNVPIIRKLIEIKVWKLTAEAQVLHPSAVLLIDRRSTCLGQLFKIEWPDANVLVNRSSEHPNNNEQPWARQIEWPF